MAWACRTIARGAETSVQRDGPFSLYVTTSSGLVYGVIFHGEPRRCITTPGCTAVADDDPHDPATLVWRPGPTDAVLPHEHQPSYPAGAPQPGTWTAHS